VSAWYSNLSCALSPPKSKGAKSLVMLVCWKLWCERNCRIFDDVQKDLMSLVGVIQAEARQWAQAGAKHLAGIVGIAFTE
jgi:hypothetical protein